MKPKIKTCLTYSFRRHEKLNTHLKERGCVWEGFPFYFLLIFISSPLFFFSIYGNKRFVKLQIEAKDHDFLWLWWILKPYLSSYYYWTSALKVSYPMWMNSSKHAKLRSNSIIPQNFKLNSATWWATCLLSTSLLLHKTAHFWTPSSRPFPQPKC